LAYHDRDGIASAKKGDSRKESLMPRSIYRHLFFFENILFNFRINYFDSVSGGNDLYDQNSYMDEKLGVQKTF
jgi:hypothetical protein